MQSSEDNDDDFRSAGKQKSLLQQKRKKLSSKHRSKSQKVGNESDKKHCDVFSPVSCVKQRKTGRNHKEETVIVLSDEEGDQIKIGDKLDSVSEKDNVLVECRKNIVSSGEETNHVLEQTTLQNKITNQFVVPEVPLEKTKKKDSELKSVLKVTSVPDHVESFSVNPNFSLNEEFRSNNNGSLQKSSSDKLTKSEISSCSDDELQECSGVSSEAPSSTNCPLSSILRSRKQGVSDKSDNTSNSNKKELGNKTKDFRNSSSLKTSQVYNDLTEEIGTVIDVTNGVENEKTVKSKYFIEDEKEEKYSSFSVETKLKSASLEHLNDSRSEDDLCNISQERCTSNEESTSYDVIPERSNEQIRTSDDDYKKSFSCPLCWKSFESKQSHMVHMKGCALRHNLSTRQLLDAVGLQEKQVAERQALGLPIVPAVNAVKKSTTRKNSKRGADGNLQLALALSASMKEAEEREQLEEEEQCLIEAGLSHDVVGKQNTMLEKYGFKSSRSVLPASSLRSKHEKKSKSINKATVLTKRTKEDRERIITEKVAIILIGDENRSTTTSVSINSEGLDLGSIGASSNIQKYEKKSISLWDASSNKEELQSHYVEALSNAITPCKKKAGNKIKRLSQLPGGKETPVKTTVATSDIQYPSISSADDGKQINGPGLSKKESKARWSPMNSSCDKTIDKEICAVKRDIAKSLINDWRSMLNTKDFSDVTIYVKNDMEIPAHKIVLYARCRLIMKDIIIAKDSSDSMLMWIDISKRAALAFLQFIYCGLTSKLLRLEKKDILNVRKLANMYQVTDLLEHLNTVGNVRTKVTRHSNSDSSQYHGKANITFSPKSVDNSLNEKSPNRGITLTSPKHVSYGSKNVDSVFNNSISTNITNVNATQKEQNQKDISSISPSVDHLLKYDESKIFLTTETENQNTVNSSNSSPYRTRAVSPDLFMDIEDNEHVSQNSEDDRRNLHYLVKMIDICFTPKNEEKSPKKISPTKSVHKSPSTSLKNNLQTSTEKMSPIKSIPDLKKSSSPKSIPSSPKSIPSSPSQRLSKDDFPSYKHKNDDNRTLSPQFYINGVEEDKSLRQFTENDVNLHKSPGKYTEKTCSNMNTSQLGSNCNDSQIGNNYQNECDFDRVSFLESLLSESPSKDDKSKDTQDKSLNTSVNSKRKYSERDLSIETSRFSTKKIRRDDLENEVVEESRDKAEQIESLASKSTTCDNVIDTLDLTQNSNESDKESYISRFIQEADINPIEYEEDLNMKNNSLKESITARETIDLEELNDTPSKFKSKSTKEITPTKDKGSDLDIKEFQDEWDSFDEMCNAPDPEIFSQCLSKLVSSCSQTVLKENLHSSSPAHKPYSQKTISSPNSKHGGSSKNVRQKQCNDEEDSLLANLNESVFWREENAPVLKTSTKDRKSVLQQEHNKYRTPLQKQKNFKMDVTPPADYSAMKTPDLKKELRRYGLKPSLTRKQAKTMLRYIYDQLHPYIIVSDSEDAENNLPSPFKVPGANTRAPKSPVKRAKTKERTENMLEKNASSDNNKQASIPVRRNLASQIDAGSDCDELSQSQESFSSSSSTCDMAEEMFLDDLEIVNKEYMPPSQEASSLSELPSVVQHHITENQELLQNVLQHEPIWIEGFLDELKAKGFKFKMNQLMDYFDEQCITFRTIQGQRSRMRKKQKQEARKKKSPAKRKRKKESKSGTTSGMDSPNSTSN